METSFILVSIRQLINWFGKVGIKLAESRKNVSMTKEGAIGT
jgi:hypothetical protein